MAFLPPAVPAGNGRVATGCLGGNSSPGYSFFVLPGTPATGAEGRYQQGETFQASPAKTKAGIDRLELPATRRAKRPGREDQIAKAGYGCGEQTF
jgi:hypothetical protein